MFKNWYNGEDIRMLRRANKISVQQAAQVIILRQTITVSVGALLASAIIYYI